MIQEQWINNAGSFVTVCFRLITVIHFSRIMPLSHGLVFIFRRATPYTNSQKCEECTLQTLTLYIYFLSLSFSLVHSDSLISSPPLNLARFIYYYSHVSSSFYVYLHYYYANCIQFNVIFNIIGPFNPWDFTSKLWTWLWIKYFTW